MKNPKISPDIVERIEAFAWRQALNSVLSDWNTEKEDIYEILDDDETAIVWQYFEDEDQDTLHELVSDFYQSYSNACLVGYSLGQESK